MISSFFPTLEKPRSESSSWYKNFHSSFYLSQMVNNVLLSYVDSYIAKVTIPQMKMEHHTLVQIGAIGTSESSKHIDMDKVSSFDVEQGMKEILGSFENRHINLKHQLFCMGVSFGDYMNRSIDVELSELMASTTSTSWHEIVKGFLNVWEFLFLFSITESTLKEVVGDPDYVTNDLVSKVLKTNNSLSITMTENHNMDKGFMISLWDLFCSIRNTYSHTHGLISENNRLKILHKAKTFKSYYSLAFQNNLMLSTFVVDAEELFKTENIVINKFYLLGDHELNIFRNFLSDFMTVLDRITSGSS